MYLRRTTNQTAKNASMHTIKNITLGVTTALLLLSNAHAYQNTEQTTTPDVIKDNICTNNSDLAADIIHNNPFITLSTTSIQCEPFSTILFAAVDDDLNFYWISSSDAQHSINLDATPEAYLSIQGTSTNQNKGVYIKVESTMLTDFEKIEKAGQLLAVKADEQTSFVYPFKNIELSDESTLNYYKASIKKLWISSETTDNDGEFKKYTNIELTH